MGSFVPHLLNSGMDELPIKAGAVIDLERGTVMVMDPAFEKYTIIALTGMQDLERVFGPVSYHGCDYRIESTVFPHSQPHGRRKA